MSSNRLHVASVLSLACLFASGCAVDATATDAASDEPVASTSEAANRGNSMVQGSVLNPGDTLYSSDGRTYLTMQTDGNLALRFSPPKSNWTKIIWASNTYGNPGAYAIFQTDGNLVVYTQSVCTLDPELGVPICTRSTPLWATGTNPSGDLVWLQDDGNLVVYDVNMNPHWATGTNGVVPPASSCFGSFCPTGTWWQTCEVGFGYVDCSEPDICDLSKYSCGNVPPANSQAETCTNHLGQLQCTLSNGNSVNYVDSSGCPYCGGPVD